MSKIKKHIIIAFITTLLIYLIYSIYFDFNVLKKSITDFNYTFLSILFLLSVLTQLFRSFRWFYYLKIIKSKLTFGEAILTFFASLVMGFTPGKLGEGIKSIFVKRIDNTPNSVTLPIVIVERITDILGLVLIAALGSIYFEWGIMVVSLSLLFVVLSLIVLVNKNAFTFFMKLLSKIRFLNKFSKNLLIAFESIKILVTAKHLFLSTLLSVFAWILELCLFFLVLLAFNEDISFLQNSFVYSISVLAGSISMLPAGLGVTEGSLTFLLIKNGINSEIAASATIIVRIITLWFTIICGAFSFFYFKKKFGIDISNSTE